jgi:hypothetical protein
MMSQATKQTIIIVVVLFAIIISTVVIVQLISSNMRDDSEKLYSFASTAKNFHEKIEDTGLIENIQTISENIAQESPGDFSKIELSIEQGILSSKGYKDQYNWLNPTSETLELFESLLKEGSLIQKCYSRLYSAWSEKQAGNEAQCFQYLEEVTAFYDELVTFRDQNELNLDRLLLQAEQDG